MRSMASTKDQIKTGWILASISVMLTASIIFWYVGKPKFFIEIRIGFTPQVFSDKSVWFAALLIVFGYITYTAIALPFVRKNLFTFSWLKVIGIWAAFVTGIVEEVLFRHVLMDWLMSLNFSTIWQVLVSAIVFGLAHGAWVLLRGDLKIAIPIIFSTTILGGLLAVLYIMTDRSTFAPIIAHILINLAIEPWLMLSAVSGKWNSK